MVCILRLTAQEKQSQINGRFRAKCTVHIHSVLNYIERTGPLQDNFQKNSSSSLPSSFVFCRLFNLHPQPNLVRHFLYPHYGIFDQFVQFYPQHLGTLLDYLSIHTSRECFSLSLCLRTGSAKNLNLSCGGGQKTDGRGSCIDVSVS